MDNKICRQFFVYRRPTKREIALFSDFLYGPLPPKGARFAVLDSELGLYARTVFSACLTQVEEEDGTRVVMDQEIGPYNAPLRLFTVEFGEICGLNPVPIVEARAFDTLLATSVGWVIVQLEAM